MLSFQRPSLETIRGNLHTVSFPPPSTTRSLAPSPLFHAPNSPSRSSADYLPSMPQITANGSQGVLLFPTHACRDLDYEWSAPSDAFLDTRSRVLRLHNFRSLSPAVVASLLQPQPDNPYPSPMTIWALKDNYHSSEGGRVLYCVYRTHKEAYDSLSLPRSSLFALSPALELELEPLHKLKRVDIIKQASSNTPSATGELRLIPRYMSSPGASLSSLPTRMLGTTVNMCQTSSFSDFKEPVRFSRGDSLPSTGGSGLVNTTFPLSSNPPNAKTNFRLGDWICMYPNCGAHNFGRNVACIGCGSSRPSMTSGSLGTAHTGSAFHPPRFPSPRFTSIPSSYSHAPDTSIKCPVPQRLLPPVPIPAPPNPAASAFPILTPSGKQLSTGGKVQNISQDPLAPCFMFWSYNEALPLPGQIRPAFSPSFQPPPILNTGNRGPIEHQPGDWICQKCSYLNWRRRKVCQTCFPYAEGNGDSISAAVQAERIALLANVLSSDSSPPISNSLGNEVSLIPPSPSSTSRFASPPVAVAPMQPQNSNLLRSRSHVDLFSNTNSVEQPIYQTSGGGFTNTAIATPCPLLPSFLQEIVHSPSLSPASSSSADFSLEDCDDSELWVTSPGYSHQLSRKSSSSLTAYNIWKLDGEETKALSGHSEEEI